ncbi:endonuclease MutS2 [Peribacillus sp. SCS-37]|uniref:endonuclease MutS2 n=1 Tax=Paraperibacillus esterisolvens TaxID=3115296 RepID=UPI003905CA45
MNEKTFNHLGYTQIKQDIAAFAMSRAAKDRIMDITPSFNGRQIESRHEEVTEAVKILEKSSSVPISSLEGIERLLGVIHKGTALREEQLMKLAMFLDSCLKLKRFMRDKESLAPRISLYAEGIEDIPELLHEINRCIRNGRVDDHATKTLLKIRRAIGIQEDKLKERLHSIIKSSRYKMYLQDQIVSERNGRYVISVKREYKGKIKGHVLDTSASGSTVFMEPEEANSLLEELNSLKAQEEIEIEEILIYLTGLAARSEKELLLAGEIMVQYDILFAKGRHSRSIGGSKVSIEGRRRFSLKEARHPLLGGEAVPLNLSLGEKESVLVITGPNTGGKTVALKTAGLLILMAQSGFHIPASEQSSIGIFQKVLIDIGDGQSIEQNLSTFSSHIKCVIEILKEANDHSLILMDELGSGTDPGEGMGLAAMILEQLYEKGAVVIATTHYSEIKGLADRKAGFINGSMDFNLDTLQPTYQLVIGKGGESQAFSIALKLGMHPSLIEKAHQYTYNESISYSCEAPDSSIKKDWEKQIAVNKFAHREKNNQHAALKPEKSYQRGDHVIISPKGESGIIFSGPDSSGNYIVQIQGEKRKENHKRLKLYISAEKLYPEDYDFDIIFESKEDRKAINQMKRRHVDGLVINRDEGPKE